MTAAPPRPDAPWRGALTVRDVLGHAEMTACCLLYGAVMALDPAEGSINPRLLTAMQHNGGHVVGAFVGTELVGFAYGFLGRGRDDGAAVYHYSALTVVAERVQGRGIGRRLKYAQRDRCLAGGVDRMRWAFDPFKTRNAHVNLDVLGAEVIAFVPAMYGAHGFGADRDDTSDRFIVEWTLQRPPPRRPPPPARQWWPGRCLADGDDVLIGVPAEWPRRRREIGAQAADGLRRKLRDAFTAALESGRTGVSCGRVGPDIAVYRFAPGDPCPRQD
ncbi:GNAT family N-acetyltransferase [Krasilnikovia sp. MM14-A1259]|uniref:GNAT family N-acetyltransferase n=1 Tax=Krasilnikovia sp. MM14-A1259 TaxID=3373539 RepID=UPI0037FECB43